MGIARKHQTSSTPKRRRTSDPAGPAPAGKEALDAFARAVCDRVEQVPPEALKPFERQSRTHSKEQVAAIMGSLDAFGFINPIIIDDERQILAGHALVEAAKRLGYATIPAVMASHLTADEKRLRRCRESPGREGGLGPASARGRIEASGQHRSGIRARLQPRR